MSILVSKGNKIMNLNKIITSKETHNVTAKTNIGYLFACCGKTLIHFYDLVDTWHTAQEEDGKLIICTTPLKLSLANVELDKVRSVVSAVYPDSIDNPKDSEFVAATPKGNNPLYEVEEIIFHYRDITMIYDGQHIRAGTKDSEMWQCLCCKDSGIERSGTDLPQVQAAIRKIRKLINA